jgi:hypothetical protein
MQFLARDVSEDKEITVEAETYAEAGIAAAKKFCRSITVVGRRVTGDPDKSGVFACYKFDQKIRSYNHQGLEFHLQEVE